MSLPTVSIVIVNYRGEKLLPECLGALQRQSHPPLETIVVDNASPDGSVALIRQHYPWVTLDPVDENLFFAKGANRGIASARGEFILLLNNDCILEEGYIELALKPMLEDESIGAVTGKILRTDGDTIDIAGQELARSRKPYDRGYGQQDSDLFDEPERVLSAGGVAPLMRTAMLEDIALEGELFDEDFVQYYEDLDLFWRAKNLGWNCMYTPDARATHYRGATGQSQPALHGWINSFAFANLPQFLQAHLIKNRYAVMAKNDRLGQWLLNLPWILAYEMKLFGYMLLVRQSLFKDWFKAFGFLKTAFRKRKALKMKMAEREQGRPN